MTEGTYVLNLPLLMHARVGLVRLIQEANTHHTKDPFL